MTSKNLKRKSPIRAFRITGTDYEPFIKLGKKKGMTAGESIRLAIKNLREVWEKEVK
jgi:hypothetical protein